MTESSYTDGQASEPVTPGQMFDSRLISQFLPVVDDALVKHADVLRSVVVIFDYHGGLNTTEGLQKAFIRGATLNNQSTSAVAMLGCIDNSLLVVANLLEELNRLRGSLETQLVAVNNSLVARYKEFENISTQETAESKDNSAAPG